MSDIKSPIIINLSEAGRAVQEDARHLRKIIAPSIWSAEEEWAGGLWEKEQPGDLRKVAISREVSLSYVDEQAAQEPHWHPAQIESYFSASAIELVYKQVDSHQPISFTRVKFTGRILIPPRICHLVRLTGLTEVLQFPSPDNSDKVVCDRCIQHERHGCSAEEARAAMGIEV